MPDENLSKEQIAIKKLELYKLGVILAADAYFQIREQIKKIEEDEIALKEAERIGRSGSFDWDIEKDVIKWSDGLYILYGIEKDKVPAGYEKHLNLYSQESAKRLDVLVKKAVDTGESYEVDLEHVRADGTRKWVTARGETKLDKNKKVIGIRGTAQDITERKLIEKKISESQNRLSELLEFSPDPILAIDKDKRVTLWNHAIEKMTKIPSSEMVGQGDQAYSVPFYGIRRETLMDLFWGYNVDEIKKKYPVITLEENTIVAEVFCPNLYEGKGAYVWAKASALRDKEGNLIGAIEAIRDISDRKLKETQLELAYSREKAMLQSLGDAVMAVDVAGKIILANPPFVRLIQLKDEDILGHKFSDVFILKDARGHDIAVEDRPLSKALATNTEVGPIELILNIPKGVDIPVEITSSPICVDGKCIGGINVIRDLTRNKEIEKLRADFLSLASHQLRTPLSGTKWLIETLRAKSLGPLLPAQDEYLQEIYEINERMIHLVLDMLSAMKLESGEVVVQKTNISVPQMLAGIMVTAGVASKAKNVNIVDKSSQHAIPTVESDPVLLTAAIETLISNAINYSSGKDVIFDLTEEKENIAFTVQDFGIGIPEDEKSRIFERFYRGSNAKRLVPSGTGLGLYMAQLVTNRINGSITFTSKENEGTTFVLHIPKSRIAEVA